MWENFLNRKINRAITEWREGEVKPLKLHSRHDFLRIYRNSSSAKHILSGNRIFLSHTLFAILFSLIFLLPFKYLKQVLCFYEVKILMHISYFLDNHLHPRTSPLSLGFILLLHVTWINKLAHNHNNQDFFLSHKDYWKMVQTSWCHT